MLGGASAWIISASTSSLKSKILNINISHYASCIIWFLVPLSSQFIIKIPIYTTHNYLKIVDQAWLEYIGAQGIFILNKNTANTVVQSYNHKPVNYLVRSFIATSAVILIAFSYLGSLN
jgi:hypothetical protein